MYLKSLELQGFKSFPEKIKLDFNKGITAVVGPNGSGKSNIADAVRWVLGEKSAKSLRGNKMEDIIFNGTENRKPLSFAEVSMIMDNSDKKLNLDYPEVTVTRRVYRSGESDYLLNGTKCRAKDILELFMDTGVGKEGYSIIGQGRIDEILSNKSEDRRMLFEEAAGIVKYRTRSFEASNKLAKERENLVRVNDIIATLESQVGPLEVQAEKAKKFISLSNKLKTVEVNRFVIEADRFENDIKEVEKTISQLGNDVLREHRQEEVLQKKRTSLKSDLSNVDLQYEENSNSIGEKRSQVEQKENDIKMCESEIQHFNENIERLNKNIDQNKKAIEDKKNESDALDAKIIAKTLEIERKNKAYEDKKSAYTDLETKVTESEEMFNRFNSDIRDKMNRSADISSEISKINARLSQLKERKSTVTEDISVLQGQLKEKEIALAVEEQKISRIDNEIEKISNNIKNDNVTVTELSGKINDTKKKQLDMTKSIQDKQSRLRILSELENSYEGYYGGVKAVLSQRDRKVSGFEGICGAVGELITLDKKYETAIEIALGGAVQNIVAKNENDVKKAISYLKTNNKGRATFLPMTAIKPKTMNNKEDIFKNTGVIGIAKELISYDAQYENIMSSLLERVIIVDTIDNGIALSKKTNYSYKIVTLDGELFNVGGSMTGGSISKRSTGIFSRGREIGELRENLKVLVSEYNELNSELDSMNNLIEESNKNLKSSNEMLQSLHINRTRSVAELTKSKEYVDDYKTRIECSGSEFEKLELTISEDEKQIKQYENDLAAITAEINSVNEKIQEYQSKIQENRDIRESSIREINDLKLEINQINNEIYNFNYNKKRIETEVMELNTGTENFKSEISEYESQIDDKEKNKQSIFENAEQLKEEYTKFIKMQEELINYKNEVNKELDELEKSIQRQTETKNAIEKQLSRFEVRKEQLENERKNLYNNMWEEYEITYVVAKNYEKLDMSSEDLVKEERNLKNQMKALGNVNMNAVEEYAEISEKYQFLIKNRDDIKQSEEKLIGIIEQLNVLMEEQFREQFKVISDNFAETFKEMFGGGEASLKLSNDQDILNCGIDIIVQPPGKTLQNMMLLSGGEKALTAISLLFAILKMKPSPFCILDEIEAALDDANVNRYADYLKNFVDDTQFIVITHRKGTMEAADILYGVTMQEKGVSKLVSVKFDEDYNLDKEA
ncbi:MAG: chromosome segregation protein SMC [Eubacterium sp.]|jgi:chromosome segregation protein|nr:chromosome segregation protein SMC [Eubacterium sp.]